MVAVSVISASPVAGRDTPPSVAITSPSPKTIARAALAAAPACASVICAFTITMKGLVVLVEWEVMVAVSVMGTSPVTGRVTVPSSAMTDESLEDHETVH
jgi:hypothetical protein